MRGSFRLQFRDAANYVLNVGNNYVNHMAAKDMTMSMAAVLREWINVRARLSPVLELMIDESTDIPNHKELLLYLRFLVDGRYVTMFWAALSVVDGTAQGLLDVIDIYNIKYDDGFEYNQPCERSTYGTGLGKKWCIIQPIS